MKKYSSKADVALIDPALNNKNDNQYLIYPPANKTSHFVKITRIKDLDKRAAAMEKAVRMYNVFENSLEIRSALPSCRKAIISGQRNTNTTISKQ